MISIDEQTSLSDGILIAQSLQGDQAAFARLVERYHKLLFIYIRRFVPDYDQACDLLQQVMLQLYQSLASLRTDEPLRPWLFRVARNRCIDVLRTKTTVPFSMLEITTQEYELSPLELLTDGRASLEEMTEQSERVQAIHHAITMLPHKYRSIVVLRYQEHLSFAQISRQLQMPEGTVKTYVQRAKPLLRKAIASYWHLQELQRQDC